jgi:non-canonical purine NTP pyrophosphatase (RdgB/HAM1 family)
MHLSMTEWKKVGRPGAIGGRKAEVLANYDKLYGKGNWRLIWDVNGNSVDLPRALALYEDAYFQHFKEKPEELRWIADNFSNVYDNSPSNVESGLDYAVQEFGGNHFQDIAIRRCLVRNGEWFRGNELLEIRMSEPGVAWNPGRIPFHRAELIPKPEVRGWWSPGSIESWYQSARYLEVKGLEVDLSKGVYFVTTNAGKVNSARRSLGELVSLGQVGLDISEEQKTIEEIAAHKAKVAHAVLCRPVICDDSGFVIPSMDGYPGARVGRELKNPEMGIEGFTRLARDAPLDAHFVMAVTYFDELLDKPKTFVSKVEGQLIGEQRGDLNKPFIKSPLAAAFVIAGQTKTIAEMSEEEYKAHATTDRWRELARFLEKRPWKVSPARTP